MGMEFSSSWSVADLISQKKGAVLIRPTDPLFDIPSLRQFVIVVLELLTQFRQLYVFVSLLGYLLVAVQTLLAGFFGVFLSCRNSGTKTESNHESKAQDTE